MIAQLSPQCALELEWPMGLCPERPSVTRVGQPGVPVTSGEVAQKLGRHILPCRGARGCIPRPPELSVQAGSSCYYWLRTKNNSF